MKRVVGFLLLVFLFGNWIEGWAQCNTLRPQVTIDFNTDQDCAPVTVTRYSITYYFNVPQNPADIQILYAWNDPANTVTVVNSFNGMVAGAGNTSFTATSSFTYTNNNTCTITPTTYVYMNGGVCPSSQQIQSAFFWGTEQQGNAVMFIDPQNYDVCFNNPIVNAVLADNSEFNCNPVVEPDNPNRLTRHVQFVYGTNHNPSQTIRNLTLTNGGVQPITDATGSLVTPTTRGTGGMPVTAGYFGPVQTVPFPADGPTAVTFPMNAPADVLNLVGNRFEVTLFNWNACNPWNGDAINPNYEDAVLTRAYLRIVQAPVPAFYTRDDQNIATSDFCIGETIHLVNQTAGGNAYDYVWTFYDDAAGSIPIGNSTDFNSTFVYQTGGQKLIRLSASNPSAQGACVEEITHLVNITPIMVAAIQTTDVNNVPVNPEFCQNSTAPLNVFTVRFRDISTGTITPQTQWRWEFYDQNNVLIRQEPAGGGYAATSIGPFDISYSNRGAYRTRLIIRDNVSLCETTDDIQVHIYENPVPNFSAINVCEGQSVNFTEASTLNSINGNAIVSREWDFNYDGVTFNKDVAFDNQVSFSRTLGSPGTYQVALRVTTDKNNCAAIIAKPVTIYPLPNASFTPDVTSGCSPLTINFTNNSASGQPDAVDEFIWERDIGSGYNLIGQQRPNDPGFSNVFTHTFENLTVTNQTTSIRLRVRTVNGCERISAPATITVFPGTNAGFFPLNYSPFNDNCSPVSVNFSADAATQSLSPIDYTWRVSDLGGVISQSSTGASPSFTFSFINSTSVIKDFQVRLTATLASGCFGDSTRIIRVSPVPASAFNIDTLQFDCERMRLRFIATQRGLNYHWVIGENGVVMVNATNAPDTYEYSVLRSSTDKNLAVSLRTRNLANCSSPTTTQSVVIPQRDVINTSFTASPATQTLPDRTVSITNTTNTGPWTFLWNFGDGTTSTQSGNTLQHTYAAAGTYSISLTVTNNVCKETATQSITILPVPPVAQFDFGPFVGCVPLVVRFTNLSRYADNDKYVWDFGDGSVPSKAINPTHTYDEPGKYTVSLTASNSFGQTTKETKPLIIEVYPQPKASFEVKPKTVTVPDGILYTSNRSLGATSFRWDFGDGTISTEAQPRHSYTKEGEYTITLIATSDYGCTDTTRVVSAVNVIKGGQVLIPNAFSPNPTGSTGSNPDSGKNDVFLPLMQGVTEFELLIFNRWGELLFQTRDSQSGWDGYYNGRLCPQDVYVYKLTASFENGERIVRVGDVNLIR